MVLPLPKLLTDIVEGRWLKLPPPLFRDIVEGRWLRVPRECKLKTETLEFLLLPFKLTNDILELR